MPLRRKFGAHMSIAGGYHLAVRAAHAAGMQTVQLFTKNNNQWRAKPITPDDIALFQGALSETSIVDPVAHTSYLINLASPDDALWERSVSAMAVEVERAAALGIHDLVVHPGAHMGAGEDAGLTRVARAIDEVRRRTGELDVWIDLESTAGQGSCLGHRIEHLGIILDRVKAAEKVGICLDTCHLFAAGYAIGEPEHYNHLIDELDSAVGLSRMRVWHLNDSEKPCGSRVDRHAAIGRGLMGPAPFGLVVNDERFALLPMILETPKGVEDGVDLDVINLRTLRRLLRPAAATKQRRPRGGGAK